MANRALETPVPEAEKHAWVDSIDEKNATYKSDLTEFVPKLATLLGQLTYLNHLKQQADNPNSRSECPICFTEITENYAVLNCGHLNCLECFSNIAKSTKVTCATCRQKSLVVQVEYVSVHHEEHGKNDDNEIKGDGSAKIKAIVRQLKQIRSQQLNEKSLVFSQWNTVLDLVETACQENGLGVLKLYAYMRAP